MAQLRYHAEMSKFRENEEQKARITEKLSAMISQEEVSPWLTVRGRRILRSPVARVMCAFLTVGVPRVVAG
jgi:hypothetical protein